MQLILERYSYGPTETEGRLYVDDHVFFTIEDPWNNNTPFASCIPEGVYDLEPHTRGSGNDVWCMVNHDLNIYHWLPKSQHDGVKRDLCLIHKGNWETDIEGCVAPGINRLIMVNPKTGDPELSVTSSGRAMKTIQDTLGIGSAGHTLLIRQIQGAHLFG